MQLVSSYFAHTHTVGLLAVDHGSPVLSIVTWIEIWYASKCDLHVCQDPKFLNRKLHGYKIIGIHFTCQSFNVAADHLMSQ